MIQKNYAHGLFAGLAAMAWLGLSPLAHAGAITNVVPASGPFSGGNQIMIQGVTLGNGTDITNITLHGVTAAIQPGQTAGQVSVVAGPAGAWGSGDVVVVSASLGTSVLTNGYWYNAAGDIHGKSAAWVSRGTLPAPRESAAAASVSNVIYLIGGYAIPDWNGQPTVYKYDTTQPGLGWSSVSNLPVSLRDAVAVTVGSWIYVLGGQSPTVSKAVYKYNTASPTSGWQSVSNMPAARWRHGAAAVNGKIYVTGGQDGSLNYPNCYVYDTAYPAGAWTSISNLPNAIGSHGCQSANGKVYVFGGIDNGAAYLRTAYEYDPTRPERGWTRIADMPEDRAYTTSAQLKGRIYCLGGNNGGGQQGGVFEFDTAYPERGWVTVSSMPMNWDYRAMVGAGGSIYSMGGEYYSGGYHTANAMYEGPWTPGTWPMAGPVTGGNSVAIMGTGLGSGSDVTNVTLCGFAATINSQTATQVLVTAGAATGITNGAVIVKSVSRGTTILESGYTYRNRDLVIPGTNGVTITNGEAAAIAKGTDFQRRPLNARISRTFTLQNVGGPALHITGVSTSGVGASQFVVGGMPATVEALTVSNFTLTYAPTTRGIHDATISIVHDGTNTPYLINTRGIGFDVSPTNGPAVGSNLVTVISGVSFGSGSDITNVTLCGIRASIQSQSATTVVARAGYSGSAIAGDLVIESTSSGRVTVLGAYAYNPPGSISTVSPNFGSSAGGDTVTISGSSLGNGSDITNVTLAGIRVSQITSQNGGQVVVKTGASGMDTSGPAVVYSTSFGVSITEVAAFTYYAWPNIAVLGIDSSLITNGAAAKTAPGTDFRGLALNGSLTHTFTITNSSGNTLTVSGITTSGTGRAAFRILSWPSSIPGMSAATFDVQFSAAAVTSYDAVVSIANNSMSTPYTFGVRGAGYTLSTNRSSFAGGTTVTIDGAALGNGADITNVTVCGVRASIVSQSATQIVFTVGYGGAGTGDVLIQSTTVGNTVVRNGFSYNRQGHIFGTFQGWTSISNLPALREQGAAASVSNVVYFIGGRDGSYVAQSAVYRYDLKQPALGWQSVSNLPSAAEAPSAVSIGSSIYAVAAAGSISHLYKYDAANPALGWLSLSNLPVARYRPGMAAANGKIYVTGGEVSGTIVCPDVYEFDTAQPAAGWKAVRSLPGALGEHGCESLDGKVYVFGGIDNAATYFKSAYVFDPFNPSLGWIAAANMPQERAYVRSATANGRMQAVGGNYSGTANTTFEYDLIGSSGSWSTLPAGLPNGRMDTATCAGGGKLYRLGGSVNGYSTVDEAIEGSWSSGVLPVAGPVTGGIAVVISGDDFGDGSDITNVTLCGLPVSAILSQSATQVVVRASPAPGETNGSVIVYSEHYGVTIKENGFEYSYPRCTVLAPNGSTITNTEPASVAKGTDFGEVGPFGLTRTFVITNFGGGDLVISGVTTNGPGATHFQVKNMPSLLGGLKAAQFLITFDPQAVGIHTAVVEIASSASNVPNYQIVVRGVGYVVSPDSGPSSGLNTVRIQGFDLGSGSDITNVIVHGAAAGITGQNSTQVIVQVSATGPGVGNILVQSTSRGNKRPINAYRCNQPGYIFGPFAGWTNVSSIPAVRSYIPCGTAQGKVYAYGGYVQNEGGRNTAWVYDPLQPALGWTSVSNLPTTMYGQAGTGAGGKLFCLGGWGMSGPSPVAYAYDPLSPGLGWVSISNMPVGVMEGGATVVSGKVFAIGGGSASVNAYDPAHPELAWAGVSNLPVGNADMGAATVDGRAYSVGGSASRSLFEFDPYESEEGWASLTNLPLGLAGLGAADLNGRLFAIGGYNGSLGAVSNVYVYDPQYPDNGWTTLPNLPGARCNMGVTVLNGKQIYVIGGYNDWMAQQATVFVGEFSGGVSPRVGPTAGGTAVTISGIHLGNGDVTNVTLCGIPASAIVSQSDTQVVVTAGAAPFETNGDVVVYSTAFGVTIATNSYTYKQPVVIVLGADDSVITNNAAANTAKGTDLGGVVVNAHASRQLAVTNSGALLQITGFSVTGAGASQFGASGISVPTWVSEQSRSNFTVTFNPTAIGLQTAVVTVTSTAANDPVFRLNLTGRGYALSTNIGPSAGGNTFTIFGENLGDGSDITNVSLCGIKADVLSQNATQVVVRAGSGGEGSCDILIQSTSQGDKIVTGAYAYNSPGAIHGALTGWTSISNLPASREFLAAAACNGKVYAIGGESNNTPYSDVFVYDPAAPAAGWSAVSNLPAPRMQLAAASVSGKVYAVGGFNEGSQSTAYEYDPNQPQLGWTTVSNMPYVSHGLGAAAAGGVVYAVGGANETGAARDNTAHYNPNRQMDSWQESAALPGPRKHITPVAIKGKLYAMGGLAGPTTVTSDTFEYDPGQPEAGWTSVSNLPSARTYHAAATVYGRAYVLGGYYESGASAYEYHPTEPANGWTAAAGVPAGGWGLAAVGLNNTIYAFGGSDQATAWQSVFASGVLPASGRVGGGNTVTIAGDDLGDGDVTNVYLCGIPVSAILSQSSTQIIVTAAASGLVQTGDVVVCSVSFGSTVKSNAYAYNGWIIVASAGLHGIISPTGSVAVAQGSATDFVCTADTYYHIGQLLTNGAADATAAGPGIYTSRWNNVSGDGTVDVSFAENLAPLGTPEWWLAQYGWTNDFNSWETNDTDSDSQRAWEEYIAGTDPTNGDSFFQCLELSRINLPIIGKILKWNAASGRVYSIDGSTNLPIAWFELATNLPPVGVWTDTLHGADRLINYRLGVQKP